VLPRTAIGPLDFMFSRTHKLESAKAGALGEALPRGGATAGFLAEPPDPTSSPTEEANTDTVPPMGRPSVLRRLWSTREFHRTVSIRTPWTAAAFAWSVSPAGRPPQ
jgi:hypothetical protein